MIIGVATVVALGLLMSSMDRTTSAEVDVLTLYSAAGLKAPVERIVNDYEKEYGVQVEIQHGGSQTLLSQLEIGGAADLYLAGDASYIDLARQKGLVAERIPVASMKPVIAVAPDNPRGVTGIDDLKRTDIRVALPDPDATALGKLTRGLLRESGDWDAVMRRVTNSRGATTKPTEPDAAVAVKSGGVDAAIVWQPTARRMGLNAVQAAALAGGEAEVAIGVVSGTDTPTAALRFARYLAAEDRGLKRFAEAGFGVVEGDKWAVKPELIFYYGSVNRNAIDPTIEAFQKREGVTIVAKPAGCGMLTSEMKTFIESGKMDLFPDMYLACDVYYMTHPPEVSQSFARPAMVSETDIVLVTQAGNPKDIQGLEDLRTRDDLRIVVGEPDQCTLGALTRIMLNKVWGEGRYNEWVAEKQMPRKPSSAMMVPDILARASDVAIAYKTDTLAERDKLHVIPIEHPSAKAVQPFSVYKGTDYPHLAARFFERIARHPELYRKAGFRWNLSDANDQPMVNPFAKP